MRAITAARAQNLPIGALSKLSGVNIETIHYYERIKMLPAPPRRQRPAHLSPDRPSHPRFHTAFPGTWVFA